MKKKKKINAKNTNVEFGIEFGDLNGAKQYEIPFMNQKKSKNRK